MEDLGDAITSAVSEALRQQRQALGLSLADVAARADVHRSTVHLVEAGRRGITIAVAARIAHALDVSLGSVILEAENRHNRRA